MRTLLKNIKNLKYQIRSLMAEKEEIFSTYGINGKNSQIVVRGGERLCPQEKVCFRLENVEKKIRKCEDELQLAIDTFRAEMMKNVPDTDVRLIVEQRVLYGKTWQTIDTMRDLSISRKQQLYYEAANQLHIGEEYEI